MDLSWFAHLRLCPIIIPGTPSQLCWHILFRDTLHSMKQDLILCLNSPLPAGVCQKSSWPGALLDWAQQDTWTPQKQGCCRLAFSSFSLKMDSHWPAPSFENMFLYVPGPPYYHSTILTIMTLSETLHSGPIYRHTMGLRCSSASQYEIGYWIASDEAHCWCFIVLRKEFLKAMLVSLQQWCDATHTNTQLIYVAA